MEQDSFPEIYIYIHTTQFMMDIFPFSFFIFAFWAKFNTDCDDFNLFLSIFVFAIEGFNSHCNSELYLN